VLKLFVQLSPPLPVCRCLPWWQCYCQCEHPHAEDSLPVWMCPLQCRVPGGDGC